MQSYSIQIGKKLESIYLCIFITYIFSSQGKLFFWLDLEKYSPSPSSILHTDKSFRNLVNPNQIWIVITLFR